MYIPDYIFDQIKSKIDKRDFGKAKFLNHRIFDEEGIEKQGYAVYSKTHIAYNGRVYDIETREPIVDMDDIHMSMVKSQLRLNAMV